MGQAFDREGNVLGEASGETKREVFDALTSKFKDAAEIRIRSAEAQAAQGAGKQAESPVAQPLQPLQEPLLQFFVYEHLPEHLQAASKPFGDLARHVVASFPRNPERTVCLRELLKAKDAGVRTLLYKG